MAAQAVGEEGLMEDEDHHDYTVLHLANTLARTLVYLMELRPAEDDEDPSGEEAPTEAKVEKVVAIGGKKQ